MRCPVRMSLTSSVSVSMQAVVLWGCGPKELLNSKQYQYLCHSTVHCVTPLAPAVHHCVMNNGEKEKEIEMKGQVRGKMGNENIGSKIENTIQ